MRLSKKISFWLFKLKARNFNQKIKEISLISAFWFFIIIGIIIWVIFHKPPQIAPITSLPGSISSIDSVSVKEASPSIQVFLFTDENLLKDLPKQINSKADLDSLLKASQNSDLNIDSDLNQINW